MAKTIEIEFEGVNYTLEFTRRSVDIMERRGFKISDIGSKPVSTLPQLFAGAFLAHHRFIKQDVIDKIFAKLKSKDELIGMLAEMYNEPIEAMMNEPQEADESLDWKKSW
ncbi:MAG: DUF5055 domain-containing protein [Acutalibacteraceae bacterium]